MRNFIEEKPSDPLHGRTLYSTKFVSDTDVKEKTVLDIGCGFGWFELDLLRRGVEKIHGIERTDKDLATAKKYIKDDRAEFGVGSATQLPFDDETFDAVVSWEVIEHIPRNTESTMFMEVKRVLKKGGTFYLSTPHNSFFSNICDPAWWLIGHRHYSSEYLTDLAERSGFLVCSVVLNGGWWEILGINNLYVAKWIFRRRPFLSNIMNKKMDAEYKKKRGFTNIFLKMKKL